ncbi:MAG: hypothetical protein ACK5RO_04095, partial [Pseudobdellovibrionaceae bacterium]
FCSQQVALRIPKSILYHYETSRILRDDFNFSRSEEERGFFEASGTSSGGQSQARFHTGKAGLQFDIREFGGSCLQGAGKSDNCDCDYFMHG